MKRVLLIVLALLTGCATRPSPVRDLVRDENGGYRWPDGEPLLTKGGEPWRDPDPS